MPIALPPPQLLEIAGADAVDFAHAQFSNDVRALPNGQWQWNAWLSPQGRVRAFFHLLRDGDERLRLLLRGGDAGALCDALARFVFRSKVQLRVATDFQIIGVEDLADLRPYFAIPPDSLMLAYADGLTGLALPGTRPRWLLLGHRNSAPMIAPTSAEMLNRWLLQDIRAGLPQLVPALQDLLLPQWLGLDRLDAVSVTKGCYPGQEIMARLHFKGGIKRALYRLEFQADLLLSPATQLFARDAAAAENLGTVVMVAWSAAGRGEALAVLAADVPADASLLGGDSESAEIKVISRIGEKRP